MSELLVRVKDKINEVDPGKNIRCTKRGDVIVACPDGWPWGKDELSDPQYRIVKMPGLPLEDALAFTAEEKPDVLDRARVLHRRAFKFDIDAITLPKEFKDFIADDDRKEQTAEFALTKQDVLAVKVAKIPITDVLSDV